MSAVRVAVVDCGSNTMRLLVADVDPAAGALVDVDRRFEVVRLGEGVDHNRRLAPEALERTFAACHRYAQVAADLGAERFRFVATSATRDADNRQEFADGVRAAFGVEPEVITGDQEAALAFAGATRELAGADGDPPPYLVVDIGGGSTELVFGSADVEVARSLDVGSVRITERHLRVDPPSPAQVEAACADVFAAVDAADLVVPLDRAATLVGVAGSITTIAAVAQSLPFYDPARVHHARLPASRVHEVADDLVGMTRAARAALPSMHTGWVDVIGAGALILSAVVERSGAPELLVSGHDLLDGLAWSAATR